MHIIDRKGFGLFLTRYVITRSSMNFFYLIMILSYKIYCTAVFLPVLDNKNFTNNTRLKKKIVQTEY